MIITRLASTADLESVSRLFDAYREFYRQSSDLNLATCFIRDRLQLGDSVILIAERDATDVIGFCQLYPTFCSVQAQPIYVLYDLFVTDRSRRHGAARALLLAAQRHAAMNGRVRMDLSTARSNLAAQALYESLGWVRDDIYFVYNLRVDVHAAGPNT